jgi:hypothetical protein
MKSLKIVTTGLNVLLLFILCFELRPVVIVHCGIAGISKYLRTKYRKSWKTVSIESPRSYTSGTSGKDRGDSGNDRGRDDSCRGDGVRGSGINAGNGGGSWTTTNGDNHTASMVASSGAIDVDIDVDHLCIDMNQLLHGCIRGTKSPDHVMAKIFQNLDMILRFSRPRQSLVLAFDGPAPFAKIITQRNRRKSNSLGCLVTPGTDLMNSMENMMLCYVLQRQSWPQLSNVTVFISDGKHPGEGELKIISWIKHYMPYTGDSMNGGYDNDKDNINQYSSSHHDNPGSSIDYSTRFVSNTGHNLCSDRILIVGSDSDILVQSICMSSFAPNIAVLQMSQLSNDDPDVICNISLMMKDLMTSTGVDWTDMYRNFTSDQQYASSQRQHNNSSSKNSNGFASNNDKADINDDDDDDDDDDFRDDVGDKASIIRDLSTSSPDRTSQSKYNNDNERNKNNKNSSISNQNNVIFPSFRSVHIDICILFALQGNDYLPKLRGISMSKTLECYGIAMNQLPYKDRYESLLQYSNVCLNNCWSVVVVVALSST